MPLTLVGKSLLIQTRPSGEKDSIDLDQILANFDGTFAFVGDGKGRFSRTAQHVRIEGGRIVAFLNRADKTSIQVAFDLEKSGIVTASGLGLPASVLDPACQTVLPFAKRTSLASGRPTRRLRLAVDDFDRNRSSTAAFRMANASEQRSLYFLAKAERELLRVGGKKKCNFARILPGWVERDSNKLKRDPRIDKLGFLRDYNCLVRDAEPGSAPSDYSMCFKMARNIIYECLDTFTGNSRPGLVECHLRDASAHLQRSLVVRRSQIKRDQAFSVVDRATLDRRTAFYEALDDVVGDLIRLISSTSPFDHTTFDHTIFAREGSSTLKAKSPACLIDGIEVDDDYDLEETNQNSVSKDDPFRD